MASKQEQREEARRLYQESIVCQQHGHGRGELDEKRQRIVLQRGETCRYCESVVGEPYLESIEAIQRPGYCESTGGHEVRPTRWPPTNRLYSSSRRPPSLNLRCERCRCNVIVYDPPQEGIKLLGVAGGVKVEKKPEAVKV